MKKKVFTYTFSIILLSTIVIGISIGIRPILTSLFNEVNSIKNTVITKIEDSTGLTISYDSLSPSILSGLRMANIIITDAQNDSTLVRIDTIKMRWNIFRLLKKDSQNALGQFVISGLQAQYDDTSQNDVLQKILALFDNNSNNALNKTDNKKSIENQITKSIEPIFSFPLNIVLKNTNLRYTNDALNTEVKLSKIALWSKGNNDFLNLQILGTALLEENTIEEDKKTINHIDANIAINSRLSSTLENSFAQISLSAKAGSKYTLSALNFYASYEHDKIELIALQNDLPFSLEATIDLIKKKADLALTLEELDPLQLIRVETDDELIKKLKSSTISGTYTASYNWETSHANYKALGNIALSPKLLGQSIQLTYDVFGDKNAIAINSIALNSNIATLHYSGNVTLKNIAVQGVLDIDSFIMPSGNSLSSTLYLDLLGDELTLFAPQIYFGEKSLTALQLIAQIQSKSIDFGFEVSDYSRTATADPGVIALNGSFDFSTQKFLQLELMTEGLFLASINEILIYLLPEENTTICNRLASFIEPYIFSFNAFVSSDLESFSYSLPYVIIADTQDDNFFIFSLDGNDSLFNVPNLDIVFGDVPFQCTLSGDLGDGTNEMMFNTSFFANSIPYSFTAVAQPNDYIEIIGNYGFNIRLDFEDNNSIFAQAKTQALPIKVGDNTFSITINSDTRYISTEEWDANIALNIENKNSTSIISPSLGLLGTISPLGVNLSQITYSDDVSTVTGDLLASWLIYDGIFENANVNILLEDLFSNEKYTFDMNVENSQKRTFDDANFAKGLNVFANALIQDSPAARFLPFQTEENTINSTLNLSGSIENPYANFNFDNTSLLLGRNVSDFTGNLTLQDMIITIQNMNILQRETKFTNVHGEVSLEDFSGIIKGGVEGRLSSQGDFYRKTFSSPISLRFNPIGDNKDLPLAEKSFKARLLLEKLEGSFFDTQYNYPVEVIRTPGRTDLSIGQLSELKGHILDTGSIELVAKEGFFVQFDGKGLLSKTDLILDLNNIVAKGEHFSRLVDLPYYSLHSGTIVGNASLFGPLNDLQITADLQGKDVVSTVPDYVNERLLIPLLPIEIKENILTASNIPVFGEESGGEGRLDIVLNLEQLAFNFLTIDVKTLEKEQLKVRFAMAFGSFHGLGETDLSLLVEENLFEIRGTIDTEQVEAIISLGKEEKVIERPTDTVIDLTISVGSQSQLYLPSKTTPVIRGLVTQKEPLKIQMDTRYGTSYIGGDFEMKGGEIIYLNRTFFARNARAVIDSPLEEFDPKLTARAEIRERDEDGEAVQIILSVEDQYLSELKPRFESIPSMSEQDIMTLLGQLIIGMSDNTNPLSLLGSIADYGVQLLVFRNLENAARDLLNLDIFSFRTMFLKNAFNYAIDRTESKELTAAKILDGTTLYIGKYLDEFLYTDAMLNLIYEKKYENLGLKGLVFQPEFGVELPSPIGTIRWSIAPELTQDLRLLVPYTSISLSWKFNF